MKKIGKYNKSKLKREWLKTKNINLYWEKEKQPPEILASPCDAF